MIELDKLFYNYNLVPYSLENCLKHKNIKKRDKIIIKFEVIQNFMENHPYYRLDYST